MLYCNVALKYCQENLTKISLSVSALYNRDGHTFNGLTEMFVRYT